MCKCIVDKFFRFVLRLLLLLHLFLLLDTQAVYKYETKDFSTLFYIDELLRIEKRNAEKC